MEVSSSHRFRHSCFVFPVLSSSFKLELQTGSESVVKLNFENKVFVDSSAVEPHSSNTPKEEMPF